MRKAAIDVVEGQGGIEQVVVSVANMSRTVDATVETQQMMTHGIAEGAIQASEASHEIHRNVAAISDTAQAAAAGANQVQSAATLLSATSRSLTRRVDRFLEDVREA